MHRRIGHNPLGTLDILEVMQALFESVPRLSVLSYGTHRQAATAMLPCFNLRPCPGWPHPSLEGLDCGDEGADRLVGLIENLAPLEEL